MNALLALLASALWGTSDFGGGLISRRLHPFAAVLISQAIALAGLLALLPAGTDLYGTLLLQRTGGILLLGPVVLRAGILRRIRLSPHDRRWRR